MIYDVRLCPSFKHSIRKLERKFAHVKDDVRPGIELIRKEPRIAPVMRRSSGLRKLRLCNRDQGTGKRGGYRLIYKVTDHPVRMVYLLLVYSKSHNADITTLEVRELLAELREELAEQ